jgi:hypothetical protein
MATYLQGVTDYIPQVQPFQPNMNLYANVLQQKQTKYDQNWESINNVYSQLIYADLSREDNQGRRDELVKAIDFNLKKVSGLDLSLQQNTRQAKQLFTPFYEDKFLMKDIAWTKNFTSEASRALSLKNSKDEKQRAQYWDTGMRGLDYRKQEFTEADLQDTLNIGNARYTSYVNTSEKALDIAKKAGLSIESVEFSPDGRWIIKNTNGEKLKEPLSKLFMATVAKDPAVQAVYQEQAFVNRKDYASVNASMFGGDKKQAEIKYLSEQLDNQALKTKMKYDELNDRSRVYTNKINTLQKQLDNNTAKPGTEQLLAELKSNKQINDAALGSWNEVLEQLKGSESSTLSTNNGFRNPYGDLETLRRKVDGAVANDLLYKDVNEAAETFAYRNHKQDIEANPYKVMEIKHQNAVSLERMRAESRRTLLDTKLKAEKKRDIEKHLVDQGAGDWDENGDFFYFPGLNEVTAATEIEGTSTPLQSMVQTKEFFEDKLVQGSQEFIGPMLTVLTDLKLNGNIDDEAIKDILGTDLVSFKKEFSNKENIIKKLTPEKLAKIWKNYDAGVKNELGHYFENFDTDLHQNLNTKIDIYSRLQKGHSEWINSINDKVEEVIKSTKGSLGTGLSALEGQKDKLLKIYMEEATALKDDRGAIDMMSGVKVGRDSELVANFTNRLIREGVILPDLIKVAQAKYQQETGERYRHGSGSQPDFGYTNHLNKVVQSYTNPATGVSFKNADEYKKYVRENYGSESDWGMKGYSGFGHKVFNNLSESFEKTREEISKTSTHPMLASFGEISNNSVFQTYATQLNIVPKASSTMGARSARGVFQDLQTIDVDGVNTVYSIEGATVSGIERTKELGANKFIASFINDMSNNFSELGNFTMIYSDVTASKLEKESIKMKFNKKDVETWRKNAENLELYGLDEATASKVIEDIIQNGVTIIGDDGTFKNNFATNSRMSLFEQGIAVSKEPVVIRDLYNEENFISFENNPLIPNSHHVTLHMQVKDPVNGKTEVLNHNLGSNVNTSGNLEGYYNNALTYFKLANDLPSLYQEDVRLYNEALKILQRAGN